MHTSHIVHTPVSQLPAGLYRLLPEPISSLTQVPAHPQAGRGLHAHTRLAPRAAPAGPLPLSAALLGFRDPPAWKVLLCQTYKLDRILNITRPLGASSTEAPSLRGRPFTCLGTTGRHGPNVSGRDPFQVSAAESCRAGPRLAEPRAGHHAGWRGCGRDGTRQPQLDRGPAPPQQRRPPPPARPPSRPGPALVAELGAEVAGGGGGGGGGLRVTDHTNPLPSLPGAPAGRGLAGCLVPLPGAAAQA